MIGEKMMPITGDLNFHISITFSNSMKLYLINFLYLLCYPCKHMITRSCNFGAKVII